MISSLTFFVLLSPLAKGLFDKDGFEIVVELTESNLSQPFFTIVNIMKCVSTLKYSDLFNLIKYSASEAPIIFSIFFRWMDGLSAV